MSVMSFARSQRAGTRLFRTPLERWNARLRAASTPAITDAAGQPREGSIATVDRVRVAGSDQWISVRGRDVRNPLLVFLCGGPCASEMALLRHYTPALEDHFVVVVWDYRGAAKSFDAIRQSTPTIERHVDDMRELVEQLTERFGQSKVLLVGHSWGSVPGLAFASRYGSKLHAYVGIEQIVNVRAGHLAAYRSTMELARRSNDRRAVWLLERIGPPPYPGRWWRMARHWTLVQTALRLGHDEASQRVVRDMARVTWEAPEYSWIDRFNFVRALTVGFVETVPHMDEIDFARTATRLEVPAFFLHGRHDVLTPADLVHRYVEQLDAPLKKIIWFDKAGHLPPYEEPERFVAALVDEVLPVTVAAR